MASAATYNRMALGKIWNLHDLPEGCPGYQILLRGDLDHDLAIEPEELDRIDWIAFSEAVGDFQEKEGLAPRDAKLGPATLEKLQECYGVSPARSGILQRLGDLAFRPAATPVSEPPGPQLLGRTPEERSLCNLWNRYGAAIYREAQTYGLPVDSALAVFCVESQMAYDPRTGLVIIRFEPQIFRRKTGQTVAYSRGGQRDEWQNLARAYDLEGEAVLWSTSYGLPQLMGFNWQVTRHPSLRAMVLAFQDSCEAQVAGFFNFVEHNGLTRYILNADWREFTRRYNGPGNVEGYSVRLLRALKVVKSLQADGARFVV
ncbi:MAG: N-acetylmuramidase domain-containing protein [Desulfobaccales bacterium]